MNTATKTMTKKDFIDRIAAANPDVKRQDIKAIVQSFLDVMIDELGEGHRLEFRDFGVFEVKRRAARVAQNPKTLEPVRVPPKRTVKFKVGRLMKERLDAQNKQEMEAAGMDHGPVGTVNGTVHGTRNGTHHDEHNGVLAGVNRLTRHAS